MGFQIFEIKFEVDSEERYVKELGLEFVKEYIAIDYYLIDGEKTLKLKLLSDKLFFYEISYDGDCFDIKGKEVTEKEGEKLFEKKKSEINRRKRVYFWKKFEVKVDFDYMKEFPSRLFLEVHSDNKKNVLKAKKFLKNLKEIKIGYDKLK